MTSIGKESNVVASMGEMELLDEIDSQEDDDLDSPSEGMFAKYSDHLVYVRKTYVCSDKVLISYVSTRLNDEWIATHSKNGETTLQRPDDHVKRNFLLWRMCSHDSAARLRLSKDILNLREDSELLSSTLSKARSKEEELKNVQAQLEKVNTEKLRIDTENKKMAEQIRNLSAKILSVNEALIKKDALINQGLNLRENLQTQLERETTEKKKIATQNKKMVEQIQNQATHLASVTNTLKKKDAVINQGLKSIDELQKTIKSLGERNKEQAQFIEKSSRMESEMDELLGRVKIDAPGLRRWLKERAAELKRIDEYANERGNANLTQINNLAKNGSLSAQRVMNVFDISFLPRLSVYLNASQSDIFGNDEKKTDAIYEWELNVSEHDAMLQQRVRNFDAKSDKSKSIPASKMDSFQPILQYIRSQSLRQVEKEHIDYWPWTQVFCKLLDKGAQLSSLLSSQQNDKKEQYDNQDLDLSLRVSQEADERKEKNNLLHFQFYDHLLSKLLSSTLIESIKSFFESELGSLITSKKNQYESAVRRLDAENKKYEELKTQKKYTEADNAKLRYLRVIAANIVPANMELRKVLSETKEHHADDLLENSFSHYVSGLQREVDLHREYVRQIEADLLQLRVLQREVLEQKREIGHLFEKKTIQHQETMESITSQISNLYVSAISGEDKNLKKIASLMDMWRDQKVEFDSEEYAHRLQSTSIESWLQCSDALISKLQEFRSHHQHAIKIYEKAREFGECAVNSVNEAIKGLLSDLSIKRTKYEAELIEHFTRMYVEEAVQLWQLQRQIERKVEEQKEALINENLHVEMGSMLEADEARKKREQLEAHLKMLDEKFNEIKKSHDENCRLYDQFATLFKEHGKPSPEQIATDQINHHGQRLIKIQELKQLNQPEKLLLQYVNHSMLTEGGAAAMIQTSPLLNAPSDLSLSSRNCPLLPSADLASTSAH